MVELYSSIHGTQSALVHTKSPLFVFIFSFLSPFSTSNFPSLTKGNHSNMLCMHLFVIVFLQNVYCFVYIHFLFKVSGFVLTSSFCYLFFSPSTLCFKDPSTLLCAFNTLLLTSSQFSRLCRHSFYPTVSLGNMKFASISLLSQ